MIFVRRKCNDGASARGILRPRPSWEEAMGQIKMIDERSVFASLELRYSKTLQCGSTLKYDV
jgi:hypothetical protein